MRHRPIVLVLVLAGCPTAPATTPTATPQPYCEKQVTIDWGTGIDDSPLFRLECGGTGDIVVETKWAMAGKQEHTFTVGGPDGVRADLTKERFIASYCGPGKLRVVKTPAAYPPPHADDTFEVLPSNYPGIKEPIPPSGDQFADELAAKCKAYLAELRAGCDDKADFASCTDLEEAAEAFREAAQKNASRGTVWAYQIDIKRAHTGLCLNGVADWCDEAIEWHTGLCKDYGEKSSCELAKRLRAAAKKAGASPRAPKPEQAAPTSSPECQRCTAICANDQIICNDGCTPGSDGFQSCITTCEARKRNCELQQCWDPCNGKSSGAAPASQAPPASPRHSSNATHGSPSTATARAEPTSDNEPTNVAATPPTASTSSASASKPDTRKRDLEFCLRSTQCGYSDNAPKCYPTSQYTDTWLPTINAIDHQIRFTCSDDWLKDCWPKMKTELGDLEAVAKRVDVLIARQMNDPVDVQRKCPLRTTGNGQQVRQVLFYCPNRKEDCVPFLKEAHATLRDIQTVDACLFRAEFEHEQAAQAARVEAACHAKYGN